MSKPTELSSQILLEVDGVEVPRAVLIQLVEVEVDQHAYLPAMATVRLDDPELRLLDNGPFNLACLLRINAELANGKRVLLFEGEITALEPAFGSGMNAELTVRAFDRLHRLYRKPNSVGHQNVKDSDIAKAVAAAAGLRAEVEETATVYEHLAQYNEPDLCFLQRRAARIGYECFVSERVLYFRKPGSDASLPALIWGRDLTEFAPRMTLAQQVDEVLVKGWDHAKKSAIVGRAAAGKRYAQIGEAANGAAWARQFGPGSNIIVDEPVVSQAEADVLAAAKLDAISAGFVAGTGEAYRRPDLQPGRAVELEALGERLSGRYWLGAVRHRYAPSGLTAQFSVCSAHLGMLETLSHTGGSPVLAKNPVIAIVTNTDDPKACGQVRVKYPWLSEQVESGWIRVIGAGAGRGCGLFALPAVGDEVLVVFLHGDANFPVVLGGLWNGEDALPEEAAAAQQGRRSAVRTWRSRGGHRITCDDDANTLTLTTAGGHIICMDDSHDVVAIQSQGKLKLHAGDIEVASQGNIKLTADKRVEISGETIHLN